MDDIARTDLTKIRGQAHIYMFSQFQIITNSRYTPNLFGPIALCLGSPSFLSSSSNHQVPNSWLQFIRRIQSILLLSHVKSRCQKLQHIKEESCKCNEKRAFFVVSFNYLLTFWTRIVGLCIQNTYKKLLWWSSTNVPEI